LHEDAVVGDSNSRGIVKLVKLCKPIEGDGFLSVSTKSMNNPSKRVVIKAVGDVCLAGVEGDPFIHVDEMLTADLVFGNLECCLTHRTEGRKKNALFAAEPATADYLSTGGFNLICLANNHVLDFGTQGLVDTLDELERRRLRYFGAGRDLAEASRVFYTNSNGLRIALVSTVDAAGADDGPTVSTLSTSATTSAIARARDEADIVLVSYHGGTELETVPSSFVVRSLRQFIDAGADIVLGHHPHVLQAVEAYKSGVIAYSLGNFVFDNRRYGENAGLVARSTILELVVQVGEDGSNRIEHTLHPVETGPDMKPRSVSSDEAGAFDIYMNELRQALETIDVDAPDVTRMNGFASEIHNKSLKTILTYAVRHRGDFSFREIVVGGALVIKHGFNRLFGRGPNPRKKNS